MKHFRKSVVIPTVLLTYLAVMAYMGREKLFAGNYFEYFGILIVTLLCIAILYFTMRKQEQIRERKQREIEEQERKQQASEQESGNDEVSSRK